MRKGLTLGAILGGVLLAGCSGGGAAPEPPSSAPVEPPAPPSSSRTAPAKQLQVADACGVLTPEQQQAIGVNEPPRARESNGVPGCTFEDGGDNATDGWSAFAAVKQGETLQQFTERMANEQPATVAGYPAVQIASGNRNCIVSVDVSDQGSVFVNGISRNEAVNGCDVMKKVAEAVVQNLPNA